MDYRRPTKRRLADCFDDDCGIDKMYKFRVLLPNGTCLSLSFREPDEEMSIEEFVDAIRTEYVRTVKLLDSPRLRRKITWHSKDLYLEDASENKIRSRICFKHFKPYNCHILRLHDGSGDFTDTFEKMWDLTPDTDLLEELPDEYTFETALADLIAVWSNGNNERRLISVDITEDRISIFDTGPGMDGSDDHSIVKWGKMGTSLHRLCRRQAIGGNPPYLMPFFGMFGYGGPIASMHLGRHALVSSKTKVSKKVFALHLEREALISSSGSENTWRTDGGIRGPLGDEIQKSPHGSFTKVEIFEPKIKSCDIFQIQCKLKDIYFPYIQCDEVTSTGKSITPIEFQVNDVNLAEIEGGEVATTNLHSCNGPDFVVQLCFHQDTSPAKSPSSKTSTEANARLKFVYFPIVKGKENIERILQKLEAEGCGIRENYDTFSHVSIRRLGRLLPDARWAWLPFMDPRQKKADKVRLLKRCFWRVKCFIETDAGFNPTTSKTDLAHHHPYTAALKNFGNKAPEKEKDVGVKIYRDGKQVNLSQLEKDYQNWISQMHDLYDQEIDCGEDEPVLVIDPLNKKQLGITSNIARVHEIVRRKGFSWKRGNKIKILKGACAGCHSKNVYATLEYILLEGLQGDLGGGARIVCRPLGLPEEKGCLLSLNEGNASLDIRDSLSLPISIIDSGKCLAVEYYEWKSQLDKQRQKAPSTIDILGAIQCREVGVDGALPVDDLIYAGHVPPDEIIAVIRPASYIPSSASRCLDQKSIIKDNLEMYLEVKFTAKDEDLSHCDHIYSTRIQSSSRNGINGLYIFPLGRKFPKLFQKAGVYIFSFFSGYLNSTKCERRVVVKASLQVERWGVLRDCLSLDYIGRVGSCFPPLSITCYDEYNNRVPFLSIPEVKVKLTVNERVLTHINKMKVELSADKLTLEVKDILIESGELDMIRPSYESNLVISTQDELFSVRVPCQVIPGSLNCATAHTHDIDMHLLPGLVIEKFILELFDKYGNHVKEGMEVVLQVVGLQFQDQIGSKREADANGGIDLSGLLKVTCGYGKTASISVLSDTAMVVYKKEFHTEGRTLRLASKIPEVCVAGSELENVTYVITNADVDVNVPSILLPKELRILCFVASHSRHLELHLVFKANIVQAPAGEQDDIYSHRSDENDMLFHDSAPPTSIEYLMESILKDEKGLENDVCKLGLRIGKLEMALKVLNDSKVENEEELSELRASLELGPLTHLDYLSKEVVLKGIENKGNFAAAVICGHLKEVPSQPQNPFMEDIVGLVALLGTVISYKLSSILAEYLGEDQMLAVVCKTSDAAYALEKYDHNGQIDRKHALHALASTLGKSITGRFNVICLDDIRPYRGEKKVCDPQRMLNLRDPTLPNGKIPPGFLGYAVNMIDLESCHLHTRTFSGHDLRDTLFYRLFGELQVYETREFMKRACPYIKHGAVSLDGGILRGNGIVSFGHGEPEICFPVVNLETRRLLSVQGKEVLNKIEEKKSNIRLLDAEIEKYTNAHEKALKKFNKKKEKYSRFIQEKTPLLSGYYLEHKSTMDRPQNSPCK